MKPLVRAIEALSRGCGYLAAGCVFALIALMVYEVIVRYVLNAPTIWGYEVSTWVMGASFVLAIGYTLSADAHVRIDLLHPRLGRQARPVVDLVGHALVLLPVLGWLTWAMWQHFHGAYLSNEVSGQSAWNPRVWPFRLVLVVGLAIWTLQVLAEIVKALIELREKR